jgi:CheY-like chemotaxis protein
MLRRPRRITPSPDSCSRKEGLVLLRADTGVKAIEQFTGVAHAEIPGLILVAHLLPMMTIREFITEVRNIPPVGQIPIVVLGSLIAAEEEHALYKAGVDHVFRLSSDLADCERVFAQIRAVWMRGSNRTC